MPSIDFTDEEYAAVQRNINDDLYPSSPRLDPLKSALAKLDPASATALGTTTVARVAGARPWWSSMIADLPRDNGYSHAPTRDERDALVR